MISFSLSIAHTPWVPERVETFQKLCRALGATEDRGVSDLPVKFFTEREPCHVWAEKSWSWATKQNVTHCIFLQDDVRPAPQFWAALRAMVTARPDQIIGLESVHPLAAPYAQEGRPGYTTSDGLVGVAYVVPRPLLVDFLQWRSLAIRSDIMARLLSGEIRDGEDTLLGLWCLVTNRRIWCPLPTIVDHEPLASTYGNDAHANRRPLARWDTLNWGEMSPDLITEPEFWLRDGCRHAGRMYDRTPQLAQEWLSTPLPESEMRHIWADHGLAERRRVTYWKRSLDASASPTRLFVAIPCQGSIHPETATSVWLLERDEQLELERPFELTDIMSVQQDIVKTRSRMAAHFFYRTDADYMLFLDSDVSMKPAVVRGMMAAGKAFVASPYPRRDQIRWDTVRRNAVRAPPFRAADEAAAYAYSIHLLPGESGVAPGEDGCVEVARLPLGCALLRRDLVGELLTQHAAGARTDPRTGMRYPQLFAFRDDPPPVRR